METAIFRINYKSDFILTLNSDAGWLTPFCIKFWTGAPSQAYFVGFDGETYTHCAPVEGEPTKLLVQFDDHHLPVGELKFQIGYHFTVADFPTSVEDEVLNQAAVIIDNDGTPEQVMLDFTGETSPEIEFSLPAYANEAQRIANEEQRIENEQARIENEQQRIAQETARVNEFATLKSQSQAATSAANNAASLANEKAQLAADKAALADAAANLATQKAQLAADKAALAQQKAEYAQAQGDYAKAQGDTALADHERAVEDHTQAGQDHTTASNDHITAGNDHTRAESDHTRAESDHAAVEVYVDSLGAFDISAYHATGGELAKYADITAAIGTNGANIPEEIRKGGMSVKFVHSSDNIYIQCRLKADEFSTDEEDWEQAASVEDLENGNVVPQYAKTLEDWADQKAIATPDTYTDAVRTTGGDIPVETSAGSKPESIKPVAGSKWTAKMLFNGSYNMLNAAKWGAANSQPYVGGVGSDYVYFLVPELTLGTFGTADENNGLLFTDSEGENVQPASAYFKPLGTTVPQSLTDGTLIAPTTVNYDGKTYKDYATDGAGWLIVPKTVYDNDVCAHIAWEDWYNKYVSLNEPTTNPEAVVGTLMLEGLLALAHSDKYLRGVNDEVCDNVVFGDTSATITHMVDELSVAANAWTNAATGESDSQGNALYRHSATVSLIKQGGAACLEGEDGGIPLTVNGTTVSYIDTNAAAPASTVFYEVAATSTTKAYTDSVFNGSNINTETGVLPINDCSIEAQVGMVGKANITVKYAKNIVDQVAINATVDVPQIKEQVENQEERITELEDTAVRTGSYDASVSVGLADNLRGDAIVSAEFYKRKTGGTQSVGSGIAAIKEIRGKSIVWNQLNSNFNETQITASATSGTKIVNISNLGRKLLTSHKYYISGYCYVSDDFVASGQQPNLGIFLTTQWSPYGGALYIGTDLKGVWVRRSAVVSSLNAGNQYVSLSTNMTISSGYVSCKNVQVIDLTLMFGSGKEPTAADFEKMFQLDFYDRNTGEVIPFAGQNLVTTGKNQYNPATGKANLLGGQTYQIGGTYTGATIDGVAVTLDSNNCFTTTNDCVLDITGGNDTDTMVAIYDGENGAYEPYEKHTLPLDPSQWRDKQGNLVFPYGGMFGYGTAYDYAKIDTDGYIRKAVRVFGVVDFGTMQVAYKQPGYNRFVLQILPTMKPSSKNLVSIKYIGGSANYQTGVGYCETSGDGYFMVNEKDVNGTEYTDVASFQAAMQGVMLYYELKTPVEVELATPIYAKYLVHKDGTEEITPANGAAPYTTMANLSILYAMDARGEIKNLPKNYLSKESTENMLNAMVAAGVIQSYTMIYDAANARYQFAIVAPTQSNE